MAGASGDDETRISGARRADVNGMGAWRDIAAGGRVTNGLACMAETPEQRVVGHFE